MCRVKRSPRLVFWHLPVVISQVTLIALIWLPGGVNVTFWKGVRRCNVLGQGASFLFINWVFPGCFLLLIYARNTPDKCQLCDANAPCLLSLIRVNAQPIIINEPMSLNIMSQYGRNFFRLFFLFPVRNRNRIFHRISYNEGKVASDHPVRLKCGERTTWNLQRPRYLLRPWGKA
jgi:hypothetical protein